MKAKRHLKAKAAPVLPEDRAADALRREPVPGDPHPAVLSSAAQPSGNVGGASLLASTVMTPTPLDETLNQKAAPRRRGQASPAASASVATAADAGGLAMEAAPPLDLAPSPQLSAAPSARLSAASEDLSGHRRADTAQAPGPGGHARPGDGEAPSKEDGGASVPDWDKLAQNMGHLVEEGGKAAAAFLKAREAKATPSSLAGDVTDMVKTLGQVATQWMSDPVRVVKAQAEFSTQFIDLWSESLRRFTGGEPAPQKAKPEVSDKRFAAPEWRANPVFDFLRQSYLMTTDWASTMVEEAEGLHPLTREKARFYLKQVSGALSPSNFLATNPELLRTTFEQGGENLVRGMKMLAEDIAAGEGDLRIRQSDRTPFQLGVNMATTPGKVVFRNDLIELLQYAPATPDVLRRPLLIVPPWINKFYVLDLNPEKSLIRWMVERGLTVFVVSWVNPDERHADKGFEAYMTEGIFAALDAIELATGEREVSTIGYCVGGTLLAVALAYMAAKQDRRIASATFFTAQTDFRDAGDLKVFAGEEQIAELEAEMAETGYLKGAKMANAFNMLRPNELIWSYVVNNYLKGQAPSPFDLLVWNSDSTRMPAANHIFYLRNCYLENKLTRGDMEIGGERLDLGEVTIPVYNLATREDHIAPARSVFTGAKYFAGPMRFVLAGSGHIAGVVNPPAKAKYQYWSGPPVEGTFDEWLAKAKETKGSWWPDWLAWVSALAPERVPPRVPGEGRLPALCDAPGEYVRVQA